MAERLTDEELAALDFMFKSPAGFPNPAAEIRERRGEKERRDIEIECLKAENLQHREQVTHLCTENAKLREALAEYSKHDCRCVLSNWMETEAAEKRIKYGDAWYIMGSEPSCTCGLDAALLKGA